jgi:hypothetical protein
VSSVITRIPPHAHTDSDAEAAPVHMQGFR